MYHYLLHQLCQGCLGEINFCSSSSSAVLDQVPRSSTQPRDSCANDLLGKCSQVKGSEGSRIGQGISQAMI